MSILVEIYKDIKSLGKSILNVILVVLFFGVLGCISALIYATQGMHYLWTNDMRFRAVLCLIAFLAVISYLTLLVANLFFHRRFYMRYVVMIIVSIIATAWLATIGHETEEKRVREIRAEQLKQSANESFLHILFPDTFPK